MGVNAVKFCSVGLITGAVVMGVMMPGAVASGSTAAATSTSITSATQSSAATGVLNGDFETGSVAPWIDDSTGNASTSLVEEAGDRAALLAPADDGNARLVQAVPVSSNTDYFLSAEIESRGATAVVGVKGHQGKWTQIESAELPMTFRTAAGVTEIEIYLQAWKRQTGGVTIDDVVLSDGTAPPPPPSPSPTPDPTNTVEPSPEPTNTAEPSPEPSPSDEPTSNPTPDPSAPAALELKNPEFNNGKTHWQDLSAAGAAANVTDGVLTLDPSDAGTARIAQQVAVEPNSVYTIFLDRAEPRGEATAYVKVKGHQGKWTEAEDQSRLVFSTGDVTEVE